MVKVFELPYTYLFQILATYQVKYNENLLDRLKKELSGDYEDVIIGLMLPPVSYDVFQLHNAIKVKFRIFRIGFHGCVPYPLFAHRTKAKVQPRSY